VDWVTEAAPGATDAEVLARAREQKAVLVTFDRDFGDLIFRQQLPAPAGVLHLRFIPSSPTEAAEVLLSLFAVEGVELVGRYTVVERERVRQRPLLGST
jgi:predicted nuclease of predicted toxin-antitoxin system